MWIARDKEGKLHCFSFKVVRGDTIQGCLPDIWVNAGDIMSIDYYPLNPKLFPEVTWNSEPKWVRFMRPDWLLCG